MKKIVLFLIMIFPFALLAQQRTVEVKLKLNPGYMGVIGTVPLTIQLDISGGDLKAKCTPGKMTNVEGIMFMGQKYPVSALGGLTCYEEIDWGQSSSLYVSVQVDGVKGKKKGNLYPNKTKTEFLEIMSNFDIFNNSVYAPNESAKFASMLAEKFSSGSLQLVDPEIRSAPWSNSCYEEIKKKLNK